MKWKIKYRKQAYKFLNENNLLNVVKDKIVKFLNGEYADIKKLKGEWNGFLRLRIRKVRVIFQLDIENKIIDIYKADFRENI